MMFGLRQLWGLTLLQRFAADGKRVGNGLTALGRVDDEIDLVVLDQVDDVRPPFHDLVDRRAGIPRVAQELADSHA